MNISFRFFVCDPEEKHRLGIWKLLIACVNKLIPEDKDLTTGDDTSETAERHLQRVLQGFSFLFSATLVESREGYPGIALNAKADLPIIKWFSVLARQLHEHLNAAGYVGIFETECNPQFAEKWDFSLQPFLNQELIPVPHLLKFPFEQRTREDHLKIWKLLENTVAEQLEHEEVNNV